MDVSEKKCAHCSIPCDMKCSKCSKVGYCGVEHQKIHWKTHKKHCFPAIELKNDTYGNYLASTRKILGGNEIFTEEPLMVAPFNKNGEGFPVCLGCCKILPGKFGDGLLTCQKCSWPLCRQDCEQISNHSENECKIFQTKKVKPKDFLQFAPPIDAIYDCITIIRILLLTESDPEKFDKFLHLESHEHHRAGTVVGVIQTQFALKFIHTCCKMSLTLYPAELINKLLGVVLYNSIHGSVCPSAPNISYRRESYIFEKGSKLCHSCISNTTSALTDNNRIRQVFAATEIEKNEMLTECYGFDETYWKGIVERRQFLNVLYHFWCSCPRCSDPTELGTYFSAIKCKGKNCAGFYLPENPLSTDGHDSIWKCTSENCKNTEKYSKLSKTVAAIQNEIQKSKFVEEKLSIIEKHENVSVHENHFTLMKLRFDLVRNFVLTLRRLDDEADSADPEYYFLAWSKTIEFGVKCLEIANKLDPGLSLHRGKILFCLAQGMDKCAVSSDIEPMVKLKALEESRRFREEAKRIPGVTPDIFIEP